MREYAMRPHNDSHAHGGGAAPQAMDPAKTRSTPALAVVAGCKPGSLEPPGLTDQQEQVLRMRQGLGVGQNFPLTHKAGENRQTLRQLHALELLLRQEPRAAPVGRRRRPVR